MLFVTANELEINDDRIIDRFSLGGGTFSNPSTVFVNGIPIEHIDGGGTFLTISNCLYAGDNQVYVSNVEENGLFVYVVEAQSDWPEGVSRALGFSKTGKITFQIEEDWKGPIFEPLNAEQRSAEKVQNVISDLVDLINQRNGELFFEKLAMSYRTTITREGSQKSFEEIKNNLVSIVENFKGQCKTNEYQVIYGDNGIFISGQPIEAGELLINDFSLVQINGKLEIWRPY